MPATTVHKMPAYITLHGQLSTFLVTRQVLQTMVGIVVWAGHNDKPHTRLHYTHHLLIVVLSIRFYPG